MLQDGLPISTDWIGFPTLYYMPLAQSLAEVQLIRGGNSLIYGPNPAPAVNLLSKRPGRQPATSGATPKTCWAATACSRAIIPSGLERARSRPALTSAMSAATASATMVPRASAKATSTSRIAQPGTSCGSSTSTLTRRTRAIRASSATGSTWLTRTNRRLRSTTIGLTAPRSFSETRVTLATAGAAKRRYGSLGSGSIRARLRLARNWPPQRCRMTSLEAKASTGGSANAGVKGNALTFGTVLYTQRRAIPAMDEHRHQSAVRARMTALHGSIRPRNFWYGAIFAENVFRLPGRWQCVLVSGSSTRRKIRIDESVRPTNLVRPLIHQSASRTIPMFGLGAGFDFGHQNEPTSTSAKATGPFASSTSHRHFQTSSPGGVPAASKSLSWEAGVHGTPVTGLFYDASLFWIDFKNRIETIVISRVESCLAEQRRHAASRLRRRSLL